MLFSSQESFLTKLSLWLTALLWLSSLPSSNGYASWLKCFVELDPSEVIMWNHVIPASNAQHPVHIEVQPYGFGEDWLSADPDGIVPLPAPHPGTPLTLRVRLHLPPELERGGDNVQFVMEAKTSTADAAAEAVEFIDKGVMCDGARAFSLRHKDPVILQIDLIAHPDLEYVTLTAAWAPGMEAVTLTPTLTLKPTAPKGSDEL